MMPWFTERFGNAASVHHPYGWLAEEAVEQAREQVAALVNARPKELVFTSGATESINLGIRGIMEANRDKGNHLITVATEHRAVLDTCQRLEESGTAVTYLPVDTWGLVDLNELESAIRPDTVMVIIMLANNETGVIQPIREVSALSQKHGILLFSDAVQAAGKIPVDVRALGVDIMPLSAHKMYGPKGVGALYLRRSGQGIKVTSQITGGGQEFGMRSGTQNVPGIVGYGMAAELALREMEDEAGRLQTLRDRLEEGLLATDGCYRNGHPQWRLPHVSHLSFEGVKGKDLLVAVNKELAVSSGSACSSITSKPSHVLTAMGLGEGLALSSLRFGLGRSTTAAQVDFAIGYVREIVADLKKQKTVGKTL